MDNNGKKNRVSLFDIIDWIGKLKDNKIVKFEHRKLPKELQKKTFIRKAKHAGLIERVGNIDGKNIWRIADSIKPRGITKEKPIERLEKDNGQ